MSAGGLLERERELAELDALVDLAVGGRGGSAVVEGPAGIGKSRLLAEARARAEGRMLVAAARGSVLEREFPYGVVRQLFEAHLATPDQRGRHLLGAASAAGSVFGGVYPDDDAGGASFAVLHGLYWLSLNLSEERPLLLCVDDLHWCDKPSLYFLAYLAKRLEGSSILLLSGLRSAEPGTDAALIGEIAHDPAVARLTPAPLSAGAVSALVSDRLGGAPDDEFRSATHDSTGGNPLLVQQLLTALATEGVRPDGASARLVRDIGPRAVSRTVLLRLARLPDEAARVARALAVLGEGAPLSALAGAAELDESQVAEATGQLAQAEILRPSQPLGFVHPLVRDAIYQELPPAERELQHARAAALLRDAGAPAEQVAAQLLNTPPHGERWAADLLWQEGRAAVHAGAADSAVAYLERALAEPPPPEQRPQLLFELGSAEVLTSGPAAAEHLERAYDELEDPEARATAAALLGRTLMFMGSSDAAQAIATRAAQEVPRGHDDLRMQLEAFDYMTVYFGAGDPRRLSGLREHRNLPEGGPGAHMLAAMAAWEMVCTDGVATECAELASAALADGKLRALDPMLIPFAAMVTLVVTDHPDDAGVWAQALDDSYRRGSLFAVSSTHLWNGFASMRRGELPEAEESLRASHEEFKLWGMAEMATILSRTFMTDVLVESGRLDEAIELFGEIESTDPGMNARGWWLITTAALRTTQGEPELAIEAADELAAHCEYTPDPGRLWWRSLKAEALDKLDRRDEAIELARAELEITRAFGAPSSLGRTLRVLGNLEREDGLGHLREAVDVLDGTTARLEHAKALAALGSALRRARQPTEAREPLRRALELAAACGAEGLVEHARSELHATGARPRREALGGIESLTPSERRIVDLAAGGRRNRDIAQELYVTPKTVEVHLSNAYRKLGISSRRELPQVLAP
jgi:DNA-binding CsgD family transcriptional regulator